MLTAFLIWFFFPFVAIGLGYITVLTVRKYRGVK